MNSIPQRPTSRPTPTPHPRWGPPARFALLCPLLLLLLLVGYCRGQTPSPSAALTDDLLISPAPTPLECPDQYAAFNDCVDPTDGGAGCEGCLTSFWPETLKKCTDIADVTCPGLEQCQCNDCGEAWITYLECLTDGCPFQACAPDNSTAASTISPAPTPHPCPDEQMAVRTCLTDAGVDLTGCSTCIQESFPQRYSQCTDIDEAVCDGLTSCECGNCHAEILAQVNCAFENRYEKPCQIKCNGTDAAPALGPSVGGSGAEITLAPAPAPTPADERGSTPSGSSTSGAGAVAVGSSLRRMMAGPLVGLGALWVACA